MVRARLPASLEALARHAGPWMFTVVLGVVAIVELSQDELAGQAHHGPRAALAIAAAFTVLPLRWRTSAPIRVFGLVMLGTVIGWAFERSSGGLAGVEGWLALLIAFYSLGAHSDRRPGLVAAAAGGAVLLGEGIADGIAGYQSPADWSGTLFFLAAAWATGNYAGMLRERGTRLERRARRLEREHELAAGMAVADERARIARELHDVVAHALTTMVIQTGGARQLVHTDADDAERALLDAERTGRDALDEMRRMVGLLRDDDERARLAPQPKLGELDRLIEKMRATGLQVDLRVVGEPRRLGAGVDLAAYRIVQEALTNVVKHADAAHAWIELAWGDAELGIEVSDDGHGPSGNGAGGHGLVGMRERVALYEGRLETGPAAPSGFRVRASIPLGAAPAP